MKTPNLPEIPSSSLLPELSSQLIPSTGLNAVDGLNLQTGDSLTGGDGLNTRTGVQSTGMPSAGALGAGLPNEGASTQFPVGLPGNLQSPGSSTTTSAVTSSTASSISPGTAAKIIENNIRKESNGSASLLDFESNAPFSKEFVYITQSNAERVLPGQSEIGSRQLRFVNSPLSKIEMLSNTFHSKFYYCGFMYKLNVTELSGSPVQSTFVKCWVELWGSLLHTWVVPDELASFSYLANIGVDQMIKNDIDPSVQLITSIKNAQEPLLLNIADSLLEILPANFSLQDALDRNPDGSIKINLRGRRKSFLNPNDNLRLCPPPVPFTNYFALSTGCSNLFLFAAASTIQLNHWVSAIYLSLFESQKINRLYTFEWMRNEKRITTWSQFQVDPFTSGVFRGDITFQGPLQLRFPFSNAWKQYHVVATSKVSSEAYKSLGSKKIFGKKSSRADLSKRGSLWFFDSEKSLAKGNPPLFSVQDVNQVSLIWDNEADSSLVENQTMVKLVGSTFKLIGLQDKEASNRDSFILQSLKKEKPLEKEKPVINRTFGKFKNGFPEVVGEPGLVDLVNGLDSRPIPQDLLLMAPSGESLSVWMTVLYLAFGIDSSAQQDINQLDIVLKNDHNLWPTPLYLTVGEIGGIRVETLKTAITKYAGYVEQKLQIAQEGKMRFWLEEIAKGEWERGLADRKELDYKLKQLLEWAALVSKHLQSLGFIVDRPKPSVLISAMASIMPGIATVLGTMIPAASPEKLTPPVVKPKKVAAPPSEVITNSEGSVSEEEISDEGSVSDEESEPDVELVRQSIQHKPPPAPEENEFQVYAKNSLLAQVAENEMDPKVLQRGSGPFISTVGGVSQEYMQNSLLAGSDKRISKLNEFAAMAGNRQSLLVIDENRKTEVNLLLASKPTGPLQPRPGPLLGPIEDTKAKVKPHGGLLGEMDRREQQIEMMKKMGVYNQMLDPLDLQHREFLVREKMKSLPIEPVLDQMNALLAQMANTVQLTRVPTPLVMQNLQGMIGQMSALVNEAKTMVAPVQPGNAPAVYNPYAMPTLSWKKANTDSSSTRSLAQHQRLMGSNSSISLDESSDYGSTESGEVDEDLPLVALPKGPHSKKEPKAQGHFSGTESSSQGSVSEMQSSESDEEFADMPLAQRINYIKPLGFQDARQSYAPPQMAAPGMGAGSRGHFSLPPQPLQTAPMMPPMGRPLMPSMSQPIVPSLNQPMIPNMQQIGPPMQYNMDPRYAGPPVIQNEQPKPKAKPKLDDSDEGSVSDESI